MLPSANCMRPATLRWSVQHNEAPPALPLRLPASLCTPPLCSICVSPPDEHILPCPRRADQCADRDANTMSVMKAALPDDDDLLADAMDALRRTPLPPDAVQLPTSFELLGGGSRGATVVTGVVSPRPSPGVEGGLGGGAGGGAIVEGVGAGALPHQPGELQRSPSLEALLSKVQRIDASQVGAGLGGRGWNESRRGCCRAGLVLQQLPAVDQRVCARPLPPGHGAGQDWGGGVWRGQPVPVPHLWARGRQVDQAHQGEPLLRGWKQLPHGAPSRTRCCKPCPRAAFSPP